MEPKKRGSHLFTKENASENARRSHEARKAKAEEKARSARERKMLVDARLIAAPPRKDIGAMSLTIVSELMVAVLTDDSLWPKTPQQAATFAKVFLDIARLEHGEATSISEHTTRAEMLAKVSELREKSALRAAT